MASLGGQCSQPWSFRNGRAPHQKGNVTRSPSCRLLCAARCPSLDRHRLAAAVAYVSSGGLRRGVVSLPSPPISSVELTQRDHVEAHVLRVAGHKVLADHLTHEEPHHRRTRRQRVTAAGHRSRRKAASKGATLRDVGMWRLGEAAAATAGSAPGAPKGSLMLSTSLCHYLGGVREERLGSRRAVAHLATK